MARCIELLAAKWRECAQLRGGVELRASKRRECAQ